MEPDHSQELIEHYMEAQKGPLACERIISVLREMTDGHSPPAGQRSGSSFERWLVSNGLNLVRKVKSRLPGSHNRPEFQKHRYPGITTEELQQRVARFQQLLDYDQPLEIKQLAAGIFHIGTQAA